MPHTKKESKSIEKQIIKTNLIAYDIIHNMARNKFLPSSYGYILIIKNTQNIRWYLIINRHPIHLFEAIVITNNIM